MTYNGGFITVPETGIYYIYSSIMAYPTSSSNDSGIRIYVNSSSIAYAYSGIPVRSYSTLVYFGK
eukprot:m.109626 g.109626  ORF g.109626 m.109626 type:complete len:65 (+) comp37357_c0_seq1:965-1159(+)